MSLQNVLVLAYLLQLVMWVLGLLWIAIAVAKCAISGKYIKRNLKRKNWSLQHQNGLNCSAALILFSLFPKRLAFILLEENHFLERILLILFQKYVTTLHFKK